MKLFKAVLTGGPGGGKTEALHFLQQRMAEEGIRVITLPETATELILAGLSPRGILSNYDFQAAQLDLQLEREAIYAAAAENLPEPFAVLLCDRGALDGKGFIEPEAFDAILAERNLDESDLLHRYDAVFHLTSAAQESSDLYTRSNNPARKETAHQAAVEDDRLIQIYEQHPNYYRIPAYPTIEEKLSDLLKTFRSALPSDQRADPAESET